MRNNQRRMTVPVLVCAAVLMQACSRTSAAPNTDHIRGTVQAVDGNVLTIVTASGAVQVRLEEPIRVATIVQSDRAHITGGSFLGITSVTRPDGSERAVEVHVFPEAMRGSGEGSYAWDWPGEGGTTSRMTNGTAATSRMTNGTAVASRMTNGTVSALDGGSALTLQYKGSGADGSQTITIPDGIPIVAIEPGQAGDLQAGAHVFVVAHRTAGGILTADRILAGKDGVVPPM